MPSSRCPPAAVAPGDRPSWGMRLAGIAAAILLVSIFLGCMSIEIGGFGGRCSTEDGVLCQSGSILLQPGATQDVYYPIAYCRPPNLELSGCNDHALLKQQEDHFQIRNTDSSFTTRVRWKARGVRAGPPAVIVAGPPSAGPAPAPVSPTELPPAPTPILAPPDK